MSQSEAALLTAAEQNVKSNVKSMSHGKIQQTKNNAWMTKMLYRQVEKKTS